MKQMKCNQLGGPESCEELFQVNTFEELEAKSKAHAMQMMQNQDKNHLEAMNKMKELMQNPVELQEWMDERKKAFEALPEN